MGKIIAVIIGFLMIIAAPFVLWSAESQSRAVDFNAAREVNADELVNEHIKLQARNTSLGDQMCPKTSPDSDMPCVLVKEEHEEFTRKEVEKCSDSRPDNVLRELSSKCNDTGTECTPCYLVEEKDWETTSTKSTFVGFRVGAYEVREDKGAIYIGTKTSTQNFPLQGQSQPASAPGSLDTAKTLSDAAPQVGDKRTNYTYLPANIDLVVSGVAKDGVIASNGKTFVISTSDFGATLTELEGAGQRQQVGVTDTSLVMVVGGFMIIASTIASIPLMLVKLVPVIGGKISEQISGIAGMIGGCLGLIVWLIMFVAVLLLKNILALLIFFVIIVAIVVIVYFVRQKQLSATEANTKK